MSQVPGGITINEEETKGLYSQEIMASYAETVSETESLSDEERVRRLFMLCDADGDGYIDSQDLIMALQDLGLEGVINVGDLMQQMGADMNGKVSYDQFLQCRLSHKSEIDALRIQSSGVNEITPSMGLEINWNTKDITGLYGVDGLLATSSEHSLGAASGRHESWEFDSGARDLSPEPNTLHKLIEAAGGSLTGNTTNLLDLANKLHLAALSSLKGEITELHGRLQRAAQERDTLEQALAKIQLERLRLVQESEERLERQSTQYEERLTELHSVIAELTRKLNREQYNVIREEEDEEERGSRSPSGSRSCSDPDAEPNVMKEANRSPNTKLAGVAGYSLLDRQAAAEDEHEADTCSSCSSDLSLGGSSSDDETNQRPENEAGEDDLDAKAVQAGENLDQFLNVKEATLTKSVEEQLAALNSENLDLKVQIRRLSSDLAEARNAISLLRSEREELKKKSDLNLSLTPRPLPLSAAGSLGAIPNYGSPINRVSSPVVIEEGPVCKVAERVRIKKLDGRDKLLTGSQIANFGVRDPRIAEQLVASLHQDSIQEEARSAVGAAAKVRELELEVERLASRAEHLRAQNDVLSLTLSESRALGERLAVLLGKYESNCTALKMALERADRISEAYEVLASLVESEMALLLANCQVAGIGIAGGRGGWEEGSKDLSVLWKRATERRRSAENLARCLLARHDKDKENWDDSGRHTCTTSSTSSGAESGSGSGSNPAATLEPTERKVRDVISRLKVDRANLECTVQSLSLPLESALVDPLPKEILPLTEARKMDLEMAVIMQELMAMREERSKLRSQVYVMEKERAANETQQQTYMTHIRLLQSQLENMDVEGESQTSEGQGKEWSPRERKMQLRIQELLATLERVTQTSELRNQQSAELVADVKKANATLVQLLERTKKKYQTRLKRLEQQMVNMSERHAIQIRILKQRIVALEEEANSRVQPSSSAPSETSL